MQIQLGSFRFESPGAEYSSLVRRLQRRWVQRARIGRPPAMVDLGRGAEEVTLRGQVHITSHATLTALDDLVEQAGFSRAGDDAPAMPLFAEGGQLAGWWVVQRIEISEGNLRDAIPALIRFTVHLVEDADAGNRDTVG